MTLAILIAIGTLLACDVTDGLTGQKHDSNQELIAEGIAVFSAAASVRFRLHAQWSGQSG